MKYPKRNQRAETKVIKSIFLCHSSADKAIARRLAAELRARSIQVWIDEAEIRLGDSLIGKIEAAIDDVDYFAILLSKNSVSSNWVLKELRTAMHREISGKEVVVLPLLIEECEIPPFLWEKFHVDLRYDSRFDLAVNAIIDRIRGDIEDNKDVKEALQWVYDIPFTQLCKKAIAIGEFSPQFRTLLFELLTGMSVIGWRPQIAAGYLHFVKEIIEAGMITGDAWPLLCEVVENPAIHLDLRFMTMYRMLPAALESGKKLRCPLPRLFNDNGVPCDSELVREIVSGFWDLSRKQICTDKDAPLNILACMWTMGDSDLCERLINALAEPHEAGNAFRLQLLERLRQHIGAPTKFDITNILTAIRLEYSQSASFVRDDRLTKLANRLVSQKNAFESEKELVEAYREITRLKEIGKIQPYGFAFDLLSDANVKKVRFLQGDKFAFKWLMSLIIDSEIDTIYSHFALLCLIRAFGSEALLLDGRLPEGLFARKKREKDPESLVEVMCSCIYKGYDSAFTATTLATIAGRLNESYRKRIREILRGYKPSNQVGDMLLDLLEGKIKVASFVREMNKIE